MASWRAFCMPSSSKPLRWAQAAQRHVSTQQRHTRSAAARKQHAFAYAQHACARDALWEHEACVEHDVAVVVAHQHAVHADLAQSADRQDAQRRVDAFAGGGAGELFVARMAQRGAHVRGAVGAGAELLQRAAPACKRWQVVAQRGRQRAARSGNAGGGCGMPVRCCCSAQRKQSTVVLQHRPCVWRVCLRRAGVAHAPPRKSGPFTARPALL